MRGIKALKRIVALGTGLSMVGATILGASAAADLSQYPNPLFIKDGKFDGVIVVGDNAAASDVVGSIDIATAIQFESVKVEELNKQGAGLYTPGAIPGVSLTGDVAEIAQPNDLLELEEYLGDVRNVLTERDLNALKGGVVTTDEGTTDYNQYLRFSEAGATNAFNSSLVTLYQEDEDDNVGDFLFAQNANNNYMFEYELEFEEGAESEIQSSTELKDMEDEIFNILGTPFAVSDTDITTTTDTLNIQMLGGAISDILEEGETKTYNIGGKEYEVNVLIVSDTMQVVKFNINGEITDELQDGESDILKDGTRIGIREILPNEAEEVTGGDLVEFYLGATEVEFQDTNYSDTVFVTGAEVNDESIEDSAVMIRGNEFATGKFEILNIKYRLEADTLIGDLYVPPGHGVREYLDEPEGMLSPNWDIVYGGLMDTGVSVLKFDAAGDDQYDLRFTTQEGMNYALNLVSNDATSGWRWGDDDNDLIWVESLNTTDWQITEDDEFILTNHNDETGYTHAVSYDGADSGDSQLTMTDLYGESREFTWEETGGINQTDLLFGGNTFRAYIGRAPEFNITVDLNNDGVVGDGDNAFNNECANSTTLSHIIGLSINASGYPVNPQTGLSSVATGGPIVGPCRAAIVIQGGGILDLGPLDGAMNNVAGLGPSKKLTARPFNVTQPFSGFLTVGLKTLNSEFDENGPKDLGGDEIISVSLANRTSNEVGLDVDDLSTVWATYPGLKLKEIKENDDIKRDMGNYGALVELYDPTGSSDAEDLTVEYPLLQRGSHVFVVAGEYGIEKEAAGFTTEKVQRVSVGAAKLASEVEDITAVNAVVVGGPCANAAAAALMGNPTDCTAGFEAGKAMIKLFENGNKVAVLVAGFEALDTRRASRVLANHGDYKLSGTEVEVTGTSLSNIDVKAVA